MFNDTKVSLRLPLSDYLVLRSIFEHYQASCPNLTFSDFIRNLLSSFVAKYKDEDKADSK